MQRRTFIQSIAAAYLSAGTVVAGLLGEGASLAMAASEELTFRGVPIVWAPSFVKITATPGNEQMGADLEKALNHMLHDNLNQWQARILEQEKGFYA